MKRPKFASLPCSLPLIVKSDPSSLFSSSLLENVITHLFVLFHRMTAIVVYIKCSTRLFHIAIFYMSVATMYLYHGEGDRICVISSSESLVQSHQNFPMEKNTGNQKKKRKLEGKGRAFQLAEGERCFLELQR